MNMKKFIKFLFCKFLFRVEYINLDNLYLENKLIIAPNHSCIFDPFFIYPVTRNLSIMAKSEIFKYPILGKLFKHYNVFPVNRNRTDTKSLLHSMNIFKKEGIQELLIFPEGKVVKEEQEIRKIAKKGVVFISASLNIPILPVNITRRPKFFSKVIVTFGKPYYTDKSILEDKSKIINESKKLVNIIYDLKHGN